MPLTANEANEQLNDDRKEQGKNSRYEKSMPFRQPLPSRQWKPDEWFDPSVQKNEFLVRQDASHTPLTLPVGMKTVDTKTTSTICRGQVRYKHLR
jgi:hypothetical protein